MRYCSGYFFLAAVLVLSSCGTVHRAGRYQQQPDAAIASLDNGRTEEVAQPPRSKKEKAAEKDPLAAGIDNLLLANDSLLSCSQLGLHVVDLTTGRQLYARGERQRMRPASAEKVVTAIAALDALGPAYQFNTQLLTTASIKGSVVDGDVYVRGAMDPLLSVADVRNLAAQLRQAGITRIGGRLIADASMKDSDDYGWGWCWDDENPVLSPMLCAGKPVLMEQLKAALRTQGIAVARGISVGTTPVGARQLAAVQRPLTAVLQPMLKESNNLCAEAVFYQLGRTRKQVAARVDTLVARALISNPAPLAAYTVADGSGLSLYNYQTPETFTRLLSYAATRQEQILAPLLEALPVAAVDGTLKKRMAGTTAAGNVRAKTGSVTAVSTLVGYTTQRSTGHLIAFAIMNQGLNGLSKGRALQDEICIILSQ